MPDQPSLIKGDTYEERNEYQLLQWQQGISLHNFVDEECSPDFSCCHKGAVPTAQDVRDRFVKMVRDGDSENITAMSAGFLTKNLEAAGYDNIRVIGAEPPGEGECSECHGIFENADLRPYGENNAPICCDCGNLPENQARTEQAFLRSFGKR